MELRHLRYFQAVAEELHFGRAAARLNMSQPPLSQQIQKLEEEIGVQLFDRRNRRVDLTDAGALFLKRARVILEAADNAAVDARRVASGRMARLTAAYMSAAMLDQFAPILRAFREDYPDADVDLVQASPDEQVDAIVAGHVDVGFVDIADTDGLLYHRGAALSAQITWRESFVAALPTGHRLANRSRIALEDLAGEAFITMPRQSAAGVHDQVIAMCQSAGFTPSIRTEARQLPAVLALVAAGYGVSLVPACVVHPWAGLASFAQLAGNHSIGVTMIWRSENDSPALEQFRQAAAVATPELITAATDRTAYLRG